MALHRYFEYITHHRMQKLGLELVAGLGLGLGLCLILGFEFWG